MRRAILFIGLILTVAACSAIDPYLVQSNPPTPVYYPNPVLTPTPIGLVYVALSSQNLPRGYTITTNDIIIKPWPIMSGVQEDAFVLPSVYYADGRISQDEIEEYLNPALNPDSPVGMVTHTQIVRWQPILQSMVVPSIDDLTPQSAWFQGMLKLDKPVYGELENAVWAHEWIFTGKTDQTITITMSSSYGSLRPLLLVWDQVTDAQLEGKRTSGPNWVELTVSLPHEGRYIITASRTRLYDGSTKGGYSLTIREITEPIE